MDENLQVNRLAALFLIDKNEKSLVLLTGARQTGKTTLVKKKYKNLTYFNLDAFEYREQLKTISTFNWGENVGEAIFDEVQKEASLLDKIKFAFDNGSIQFSILLGSAQILLLSKIKETLAGRVLIFELFPFMLSELSCAEKDIKIPRLNNLFSCENTDQVFSSVTPVLFGAKWTNLIKLEDYLLQWGGMPPLIHINDEKIRKNWLKSYGIAYLERDLGDLANLKDLMLFKKFQQLASLRAANLISFSELARDAGISVETARRYIEYLRISYQVFLVPPYKNNLTSSLVKTPKLYWTDNGLLRELSGAGNQVIDGIHFENYIASELMKFIRTIGADVKLSFYRTRSGMEVDFILETQKGIITIEVKNRNKVFEKDFSSIRKLAKAAKNNWLGGLVVYRGNQIVKWDEKLWAVPSCRLFSHL